MYAAYTAGIRYFHKQELIIKQGNLYIRRVGFISESDPLFAAPEARRPLRHEVRNGKSNHACMKIHKYTNPSQFIC